MDKTQAAELDGALNLYIGRTIYRLKNKEYGPIDDTVVEAFLIQKNFDFGKLSLTNLHDYVFIPVPNWNIDEGRLLAILIDLKITLVEVFNTYYQFVLANNKIIKTTTLNKQSLRVEAHDACVNFVLRYRSLWDKIMGTLVFVYFSSEYNKFCDSRSRKRKFNQLFKSHCIWEKIQPAYATLEDFDNEYRTPEAHCASRARNETIFNSGKFL
jgi:hypothetical protein